VTAKPAWYSVEGHGFLSDFVNLLHPPYTLWHLSYVLIGIAMAPVIFVDRSLAVLIAFFLGLGIGAHALDETMGNPLQTRISKANLYAIGFSALGTAIAIGLYYTFAVSFLLLPFIIVEAFFAVAYNLETFNKRFHNGVVFSLSWGAIPFLVGNFVNTLSLSLPVLLMAFVVALLTFVQRTLSTQARFVRRKIESIDGLKLSSGETLPMSSNELISPAEKSLKALNVMIFVLAIALLIANLLKFPL